MTVLSSINSTLFFVIVKGSTFLWKLDHNKLKMIKTNYMLCPNA